MAIIDTVKAEFADEFFTRLEQVTRYDEITTIVLNHLEPDHTGALPELLRRAPQARLYISHRAPLMLKGLLKYDGETLDFTTVSQGDTIGFVGQTGIATGPHLHYEFRINSQQVNPMALTLPDATPLNASTLQRFKLATESLRPQLDLAKQIKTAAFTE